MLVDSHCHLNYPELIHRLDEVFINATIHNVKRFLTVSTSLNDIPLLQSLADQYDFVYCSAGVHPHDAKTCEDNLYDQLINALKHKKTIALGETGLDYYYNNSPKEDQKKAFLTHIQVSQEKNIPLIIHTRDADDDTIDMLNNFKGSVTGVFHCFSGDYALAQKALDLGFYISFSGIITFNKAQTLQEVVKKIPLNKILVETDSPFLAPNPHRGKKNEPAFVHFVAQKIAELKEINLHEVAKQTTQNFCELFNVEPIA